MAIYLAVSAKTKEARKKLESINSSDKNLTGKKLLNKFLNSELKKDLISKTSAQGIIKYAESQDNSITEFAKLLLENNKNKSTFKDAVKCQANSTGTKKDGLFYKMIYLGGNLDWDNLNKSKIKAFLLAKKDSDIDENENDIEEKDREERRMKNKDIVEKLKSGRLSDILKVFMALVLWSYLKLKERKEQEEKARKEREEKERKEREEKARKEREEKERKEREEKKRKEQIDKVEKMVVKIEKICSFEPDGIHLTRYEINKLEEFKNEFNNSEEKSLKEYFMEILNQKNGINQFAEYEKYVKILYPILSTPKTVDLPEEAQEVAQVSEEDLVKDLRNTYEGNYEGREGYNGRLANRVKGFREIVNGVKRQDKDINLKFEDSFFDQKLEAPYRNIKASEMTNRWGVNIENVIPERPSDSIIYDINNELHKNIKDFLKVWFPDCKVASGESLADYILGKENKKGKFEGGKLAELINGKKDSFSSKLFIRIIYSFEKEAKELGVTYEDFMGSKKDFSGEKNEILKKRLKDIWEFAYNYFSGLSSAYCCIQFQKIIDKMSLLFDIYYNCKNELRKDHSELKNDKLSFSDRRFCQLLRDKATDKAVESCSASSDGGSGVDYARLLKSIFTPLVNATNSGYHSEPSLNNLRETYESLAVKWKNNISSFDLIKEVYNELYASENSDVKALESEPINYNKFISVVKSINKTSKSKCNNEMVKIYKLIEEEISKSKKEGTLEAEASELFDKMGKWINGNGNFSINELDVLTAEYFYDIKYGEFFDSIFKDRSDLCIVLYILHLDKVGLIKLPNNKTKN